MNSRPGRAPAAAAAAKYPVNPAGTTGYLPPSRSGWPGGTLLLSCGRHRMVADAVDASAGPKVPVPDGLRHRPGHTGVFRQAGDLGPGILGPADPGGLAGPLVSLSAPRR